MIWVPFDHLIQTPGSDKREHKPWCETPSTGVQLLETCHHELVIKPTSWQQPSEMVIFQSFEDWYLAVENSGDVHLSTNQAGVQIVDCVYVGFCPISLQASLMSFALYRKRKSTTDPRRIAREVHTIWESDPWR
jgi:hypothetical protein